MLPSIISTVSVASRSGDGAGRRAVPNALVVAIAASASEPTGVPLTGSLPGIRFAEPRHLSLLMRAAADSPAGDGSLEIVAFHDPPAHTIYLPAGWSGQTPAELSVLVHEMVHHAQALAGRRFACPAERERQAYDATLLLALLAGVVLSFLLVTTTCGLP